MTRINHEDLKFWIIYDPETGQFTWRRGPRRGRRAGTKPTATRLYRRVMVEGVEYLEHVLAWFYMTGSWPEGEVDHRNRDKLDNRWSNLRDVTPQINAQNKGHYRNNTSGFKGVTYCPRNGRWSAKIKRNGRQFWLGYHPSAESAHEAYLRANSMRSNQ